MYGVQACCQLPVSVAHIVSNVLEPDVLPSTCSSTAAGSCNGSSCQQQCSGIPQPAAVTQSASDALPGHALHAGRDLGSTLEAAPSEMGGQQAAQDACMPAELTGGTADVQSPRAHALAAPVPALEEQQQCARSETGKCSTDVLAKTECNNFRTCKPSL